MKLTYFGHSAWKLSGNGHALLVDPFISGNPNPVIDVESSDLACGYILLSHGHGDHLGDAIPLARKWNATIIANFELAMYCARKGAQVHGMHLGGGFDFPFGRVKLTPALHGNVVEDDDGLFPTGNPAGFVIHLGGKVIYHAGDTGIFSDMKLIGQLDKLDVALLPIGDNFTMGPADALAAAEMLAAKLTIPMHYNTFPLIRQDPQAFVAALARKGLAGRVVTPGETVEVG
ncbi:metal-dependent hydrolase [bacterium]|nr:metal-dependent hydrolase [bacterium]